MSVRPYLSAVGEWMVRGVLQDRHHELCVVRCGCLLVVLSIYMLAKFDLLDSRNNRNDVNIE